MNVGAVSVIGRQDFEWAREQNGIIIIIIIIRSYLYAGYWQLHTWKKTCF